MPRCPARDAWRDAIWQSDLPALARLVALAYADHVRLRADPPDVPDLGARQVWITHARLVERTGMATNTATKARAVLIERGWLTETVPAKGRRAARYALTTPRSVAPLATQSPVDKGVSVAPLATQAPPLSRNPGPVRSQDHDVESQSEAACVAPLATDHQNSVGPPPPRAREDDTEDAAGAAALMVVVALPRELQERADPGLIRSACAQPIARGWTAEQLGDAARQRNWGGVVHGGAVTNWLRGLGEPKSRTAPAPRPPWCGECDEVNRQLGTGDRGDPVRRCPQCNPRAAAVAS